MHMQADCETKGIHVMVWKIMTSRLLQNESQVIKGRSKKKKRSCDVFLTCPTFGRHWLIWGVRYGSCIEKCMTNWWTVSVFGHVVCIWLLIIGTSHCCCSCAQWTCCNLQCSLRFVNTNEDGPDVCVLEVLCLYCHIVPAQAYSMS